MKQKLRFLTICVLFSGLTGYTQNYTGYFRTPQGNTDYHHFTRNNSGAPVYINQEGTGPILRLSSGTYTANQGVRFTVENDGKVGIGTTAPEEMLDVEGNLRLGGSGGTLISPRLFVTDLNPGATNEAAGIRGRNMGHFVVDIYGNDAKDAFAVRTDRNYDGTLDHIPFIVNNAGRVGINTTNPDAELSVNGHIHTKEVKVDLDGWSDFVFEEDYDLPTLEEVEAHIKEKGHLKDIPGAREVKENGVLLGEMDAKLLQKIEELTLYAIQQQKMMDIQQKQIETILEENQQLRKEIDALKKP
ncbi:hypothetical protein SAMN02927921_04183 [Sinomicrobium oceani]|uniref:Chaperone of endosialidase n=1 Tax=Sinomicrobium oceani TaxID=1150368 RepID=A0A1K1RYF4_9FLAO|nr:hypothetical protein [Sinomicrobium oceani]SFW76994.1 hypothetical protein SAMN02927921_04183 [Sinomicrobium oceani]